MTTTTTDEIVQNKKGVRTPTVAQIEHAIRQTSGNVTEAARALGVGRTALHARIAKTPTLQTLLKDEREALVDLAESALRVKLVERDMSAIIWTLKANPAARARGWGERTEITGKDGGPVAHEIEHRGQVHGSVEHVADVVAALAGVGAVPLPGVGAGDTAENDAIHPA